MRIAIYTHSVAPSIDGVCRRFAGILHEMSKQKHETLLFTLEDFPENIPTDTVAVKVDHMFFPSYPDKKVARVTLNNINVIYNALKRFKPEVLHIVADGLSQVFAFCALLLDIPIVGSYHTDIIDLIKSHNGYFIQRWIVLYKEAMDTFLLLDRAATTSPSFQKKLQTQGVYCDHIIQTAVDCQTFSPARRSKELRRELMFRNTKDTNASNDDDDDDDAILLVYAGRLSHEKRIDLLIEALHRLRSTSSQTNGTSQTKPRPIYLALVGDGPSANKYAQLHSAERGIYCKPRFLDHWELGAVYASSDIHVSASEFETLGNTVLEAFAANIPVVVPHTQGFQDTVTHGVNGYLFPPGDLQTLVRYIDQLAQDADLRRRFGATARSTVERHHRIDQVVLDLLTFYRRGQEVHREQRAAWQVTLSIAVLVLALPVAIAAFNIYDILVNVLLSAFYVKHTHTRISRPEEETKPTKKSA